ncbi:hypothetical protein EVAR_6152_1 [Eumeta japonica]|uniref:Uncharacterized protein n=1 Tax=Eumeta variegata TaxID=151549 RepID=A0A4C1THD8_EUMVA|nr:hypothetical protein EVAR_6152_1 [Eumeta japonica]
MTTPPQSKSGGVCVQLHIHERVRRDAALRVWNHECNIKMEEILRDCIEYSSGACAPLGRRWSTSPTNSRDSRGVAYALPIFQDPLVILQWVYRWR